MCSSPEGYGSISSTYALSPRRPRPGRPGSASRRRRPRPRPAATSARLRGGRMRPDSGPRDEKASRERGRGKLTRRAPRSLPGYVRSRVHQAAESTAGGSRTGERPADLQSRVHVAGTPPPSPCRRGYRAKAVTCLCTDRATSSATASSTAPHPGRIGRCSSSSRTRRASTTACSRSAGSAAAELVSEHGTPLVVYDEATLRARARAYREAAPDAFVAYGTKAFPNVAVLRAARRGGDRRRRLDARRAPLRAGRRDRRRRASSCTATTSPTRSCARPPRPARSSSSTRSRRSTGRARPASKRTLIRVTPGHRGRHARGDPHRPPRLEVRPAARRRARGAAPRARDRRPARAHRLAAARPRRGAAWRSTGSPPSPRARAARPAGSSRTIDLGGGLGVRTSPDEPELAIARVRPARCSPSSSARARCRGCRCRAVILEPGRSLVARAGVTLYTVGSVKQVRRLRPPTSRSTAACPTTRAPRSTAPATRRCSPNRADEPAGRRLRRRRQALRVRRPADRARRAARAAPRRHPRRARRPGAYTLAMSSTYNAVPAPRGGPRRATAGRRLIRRRETIDDLLALEAGQPNTR